MRALVVLPTYNEAENVVPLAADVLAQDERLDVLVVDDNSPDGTGDLVAAAGREQPRLSLLRRAGKLGLGTAYLAGFRHALDHGYKRSRWTATTATTRATCRTCSRSPPRPTW
jgi:dolichol-phosphate mannosyltransferase